jgi:predicted O-methyltransferase YrrM
MFKYFWRNKNNANKNQRCLNFTGRTEGRYWWFNINGNQYIPPIYSFLTDSEWEIIEKWYEETDAKQMWGESNVPFMSILQGFIMGSSISNIVELGHYAGYSTLLIGFMVRRMHKKQSLISIDIDKSYVKYTRQWINKAKLSDYVYILQGDSCDSKMVKKVNNRFNDNPQIVIIDSSHEYEHTIKELNLWYQNLKNGGLIFLHDTSDRASLFDTTQAGGIKKSLKDWKTKNLLVEDININKNHSSDGTSDLVYQDPCGLGIIHKLT